MSPLPNTHISPPLLPQLFHMECPLYLLNPFNEKKRKTLDYQDWKVLKKAKKEINC